MFMLSAEKSSWHEQLHEFVPGPLMLSRITFESDVFMQPSEFFYLLDVKEGDHLDRSPLEAFLSYIRRKQKFESVQFLLKPEENGYPHRGY